MAKLKLISLVGVDTPAGKFAVIVSQLPEGDAFAFDKNGCPKRQFWNHYRIFKRKCNAEKYFNKFRQLGWNKFLTENSLISLN